MKKLCVKPHRIFCQHTAKNILTTVSFIEELQCICRKLLTAGSYQRWFINSNRFEIIWIDPFILPVLRNISWITITFICSSVAILPIRLPFIFLIPSTLIYIMHVARDDLSVYSLQKN